MPGLYLTMLVKRAPDVNIGKCFQLENWLYPTFSMMKHKKWLVLSIIHMFPCIPTFISPDLSTMFGGFKMLFNGPCKGLYILKGRFNHLSLLLSMVGYDEWFMHVDGLLLTWLRIQIANHCNVIHAHLIKPINDLHGTSHNKHTCVAFESLGDFCSCSLLLKLHFGDLKKTSTRVVNGETKIDNTLLLSLV